MLVALRSLLLVGEERRGRLTLAMNNPKTPPRPKPIVPEITVLIGQDSMAACICDR